MEFCVSIELNFLNSNVLQKYLKETHGVACYPFHIEWPKDAAASLYIEQQPEASGEPCGIRHYLEVFCLYRGDKPHKRFAPFL